MSVEIDWKNAALKALRGGEFRLEVPTHSDGEPDWEEAFNRRAASQARQVRGGVWETPEVRGGKIVVQGIQKGSEDALRLHLSELVLAAQQDAKSFAQEQTRKDQAARVRSDEQEAERQRMEDRFRSG